MEEHRLGFDDIDHVLPHVGDYQSDRRHPVQPEWAEPHRDLLCNLPFAVGAALRHAARSAATLSKRRHGRRRDPERGAQGEMGI
jgi:hypothetical protein